MDSVKFGRALGIGARAAAKTLVTAVDAATAPNPSATAKEKQSSGAATGPSSAVPPGKAETPTARMGEQAARTTVKMQQTSQGLKQGSKQFREAVGGRLVKLSTALWLELTGVFFGIFAVFAASGAWKMRSALRDTGPNHDAHVRLLFAVAMAALFGYFCISSFVKANRSSRGR